MIDPYMLKLLLRLLEEKRQASDKAAARWKAEGNADEHNFARGEACGFGQACNEIKELLDKAIPLKP